MNNQVAQYYELLFYAWGVPASCVFPSWLLGCVVIKEFEGLNVCPAETTQ